MSFADEISTRRSIHNGVDLNERNEFGTTPIHKAKTGEIAQLLLSSGADVNSKDNGGFTPLHHAFNPQVAKVLIAGGADINLKNNDGETALEHMRNKLNLSVSEEFNDKISQIITVIENPCIAILHLLEQASGKIHELNSELELVITENDLLKSELDLMKSELVSSKARPRTSRITPPKWVCKTPFNKLSIDVKERLDSCVPETDDNRVDVEGERHVDRNNCMRGCLV